MNLCDFGGRGCRVSTGATEDPSSFVQAAVPGMWAQATAVMYWFSTLRRSGMRGGGWSMFMRSLGGQLLGTLIWHFAIVLFGAPVSACVPLLRRSRDADQLHSQLCDFGVFWECAGMWIGHLVWQQWLRL